MLSARLAHALEEAAEGNGIVEMNIVAAEKERVAFPVSLARDKEKLMRGVRGCKYIVIDHITDLRTEGKANVPRQLRRGWRCRAI